MSMLPALFLSFLFFAAFPMPPAHAAEPAQVFDFTGQPNGPALPWLRAQGFEAKLQFADLKPHFENGALWLETDRPQAGICGYAFPPEHNLAGIQRLRLTWGVRRFPQGADWETGNNRTPLAVMVFFGTEKLSSGLPFGANSLPPFLCPFLTPKETAGKIFTGKLWKQGGRYVAVPDATPGVDIVTEIEVDRLYRKLFDKDKVPAISSVAFQVNTKDTQGPSAAYLKKIELLRGN